MNFFNRSFFFAFSRSHEESEINFKTIYEFLCGSKCAKEILSIKFIVILFDIEKLFQNVRAPFWTTRRFLALN